MQVEIEVVLQHTKSTPGTHVYSSAEPGVAIPTVYIKKSAMPSKPPATIRINVQWDRG